MRNKIAAVAAAVALGACLGLAGCGGNSADVTDFQGAWTVDGSDPLVTVVYTQDEFKTSAATFNYTLDTSAKTITYTRDESSGTSNYEFSSDRKTLTLTEDDGNGGTKTTILDKVSDDTTTEPSVAGD